MPLSLDTREPGFCGAQVAFSAGRLEDAARECRVLLEADSHHIGAWHLSAAILLRTGRIADAGAQLEKAVALNPDDASLHAELGKVRLVEGRPSDAERTFRAMIERWPESQAARTLLGGVLLAMGRFDEAIAAFQEALRLRPEGTEARFGMAFAIHQQWRSMLRSAVQMPGAAVRDPCEIENRRRLFERCKAAYEEILSHSPDHAEANNNLGFLLLESGEAARCEVLLRKAIAAKSDFANAHRNLFHTLLLRGEFREGWSEYRWRGAMQEGIATQQTARIPGPAVEPLADDLHGRTIVLVAEQGLGDILFFLRFAPLLKARGAHLDFWGRRRLVSILERTELFERFLPDDFQPTARDSVIRVGDLPYALRLGEESPRSPPLLLPALESALQRQRAALAAMGPPPYVGVTWRAGQPPRGLEPIIFKSVDPGALGLAFRDSAGTLVSLQRQPAAGETEAMATAAGRGVFDLSGLNDDLEQMLAVLALLDDYVAVSNTNTHLRAGAGRSARVLVPHPPEWRCMAAGPSPWFPEFSNYREHPQSGWGPALEALRVDMNAQRGAV